VTTVRTYQPPPLERCLEVSRPPTSGTGTRVAPRTEPGSERTPATSVARPRRVGGSTVPYVRAGATQRRELLQLLARERERADCRLARTRCEDLTELLGQLASTHDDAALPASDRAAEVRRLLDEVRADVCEIAFRVARLAAGAPEPAATGRCPHCNDASCPRGCVAVDDIDGLERVVELLDERLRDLALGFGGAPDLALELTSALVAGTSALAAALRPIDRPQSVSPIGVAMHPSASAAVGFRCCVHCGRPCDELVGNEVPACSAEHLLLARILGTGRADLPLGSPDHAGDGVTTPGQSTVAEVA
jgi:hypothetical protein